MINLNYFSLYCIPADNKKPYSTNHLSSYKKTNFQHCWHRSHEQAFYEWKNEVLEWDNLLHKPALVQSPLLGFHDSRNELPGMFKQKVSTNVKFFIASAQPLPAVMKGLLLLGSFFEQLHSYWFVPYQPDYFIIWNFSLSTVFGQKQTFSLHL